MEMKKPKVIYERSRLTFLPEKIEPLNPDDAFRVVTPNSVFQMTKKEFHRDFANVVRSASYAGRSKDGKLERGTYHYHDVPMKAYKYMIDGEVRPSRGNDYKPILVRDMSDEEYRALEKGLESPEPLVRRRCQILLVSLEGKRVSQITSNVDCSYMTVVRVVRGFNEEGLASIWRYKYSPRPPSHGA